MRDGEVSEITDCNLIIEVRFNKQQLVNSKSADSCTYMLSTPDTHQRTPLNTLILLKIIEKMIITEMNENKLIVQQ